MERFCAWQERCENDVRRKLTSFHLSEAQEEELVNHLKENNFLNEERFVEIFVRGKVRAGWGKLKIVAVLRAKRIPPEMIEQYCSQIQVDDYQEQLRQCIGKWLRLHSGEPANSPKLVRHLLSKGYSYGEIAEVLSL